MNNSYIYNLKNSLDIKDNGDGTVDVTGNINIDSLLLTSLDPLVEAIGVIRTLHGFFSARYNQLTSLKGCPQIVYGGVDLYYNHLKTLEYGPVEVYCGHSSGYCCDKNRLVSLKGAPKIITGYFECKSNPDLFFTQYELDQIQARKYVYDPEQLINDDNIINYMPF